MRQRLNAALAGLGTAAYIAAGSPIRVLVDWCAPYSGYHLYYLSRRQSSRVV